MSSTVTTPATKKEERSTRVVHRRRARARNLRGESDEDEPIERAALSDTESEFTETDVDTAAEEDSEDEEVVEKSPPSAGAEGPSTLSPALDQSLTSQAESSTSQAAVSPDRDTQGQGELQRLSENAHGEGNSKDPGGDHVPVIDFADISQLADTSALPGTSQSASSKPLNPRKKKASGKKKASIVTPQLVVTAGSVSVDTSSEVPAAAPEAADVTGPTSDSGADPTPSPSKTAPRQSVRQAYLKKLNEDPSFVPTVGQFWGHDDRLMTKEMRGMSDWWRGRWFNRGRGGFRGRGRGRGAFGPDGFAGAAVNGESENLPVEKNWGHDGYEELLRHDEARATSSSSRGRGAPRSPRGGPVRPRGWVNPRGGRGAHRGGASPNPAPSGASAAGDQLPESFTANSSTEPPQSNALTETTAPHDSSTSARSNDGMSAQSKRTATNQTASTSSKGKQKETQPIATRSRPPAQQAKLALADAAKEHAKVIPKSTPHSPKPTATAASSSSHPSSTVPQSPNASATQARGSKNNRASHLRASTHDPSSENTVVGSGSVMERVVSESGAPKNNPDTSLAKAAEASKQTKEGTSSSTAEPSTSAVPASSTEVAPAPNATVPSSNAAYSYISLPPGLAMGESGLVYEIATNRPVMLNQLGSPPPPPVPVPAAAPSQPPVPMYTPRPMVHSPLVPRAGSVSYLPPHMMMHVGHPSMTPDYAPPSPYGFSQSPGVGGEPMGAAPNFFSPPRQSGRVQIRAPNSGNTGVNGGPKSFNGAEATKSNANSRTESNANHRSSVSQSPGSSHRPFVPSVDGSQNSVNAVNPYPGVAFGAPDAYGYPGYYAPSDPSQQQPGWMAGSSPNVNPMTEEYGYGGYYPVDPNYGYVAGNEYGMAYPGRPEQGRAGEGYQNGHVINGSAGQQNGTSQLQPSPAYY